MTILFSQCCTIFCYQKKKDGSIEWFPCVLDGVSWHGCSRTKIMAHQKAALLSDHAFSVNIPVDVNAFGKTYLPAEDFANCAEPERFWTLQHNSIVVKGARSPDRLKELLDDQPVTSDRLIKAFPNDERFVLRERNLSCKGSPNVAHYRICGN